MKGREGGPERDESEMQWLPQFQGKKNTSPGARIGRLDTGVKTMKLGEDVYTKLVSEGYTW